MPWHDWQFWVVTVAASWGAWTLLRQMVPKSDPSAPACGSCASGSAACAKKPSAGAAAGGPLVVLDDHRPTGR